MRLCGLAIVGACVAACAAVPEPSVRPAPPAQPVLAVAPSSRDPAMSSRGSDMSELPRLYPNGEWLPIEAPLLSMQLTVNITVDGKSAAAVLDTGAMGTTMSEPVAARLGLLTPNTPRGMPVRAVDAHGDVIFGEKIQVPSLNLGARRFKNVSVTVLGTTPDLFLIGADLLQHVDLLVAADEGLVGVFEAGGAPRRPGDLVVPVVRGDRQLTVRATTRGRDGLAAFDLLVDTGAWNSSVPAAKGIEAGIPADLAYSSITVGVAGEQEARGRFVMAPLSLGPQRVPVGRVLALSSTIDNGEGLGLLGNDVIMRFHSVISFKNAELRFQPLPLRRDARDGGPGGARCSGACVSVGLVPSSAPAASDDWPGVCLQVDVAAAYAGQTIELAITAEDEQHISLFNGGAIRAYVSADKSGARHCFPLWPQLERLGLRKDSPLTLRWVRTEGVRWPCDPLKTRCVSFTGPLAKLMMR